MTASFCGRLLAHDELEEGDVQNIKGKSVLALLKCLKVIFLEIKIANFTKC